MAATGKTTNYELGLYRPLDTMAPLVTENNNMTIIDRQMKLNETAAATNAALIEAVQEDVTDVQNTLLTVKTNHKIITCNNYSASTMKSLEVLDIGPFNLYRAYFQVNISDAIIQTINGVKYVQICSFPDQIKTIIGNSPQTGNSIAALTTLFYKNDGTISIGITTIIGYRQSNVTYIVFHVPSTELNNVVSLRAPLFQFDS